MIVLFKKQGDEGLRGWVFIENGLPAGLYMVLYTYRPNKPL